MAIDWQRLADDDYYASVCTALYETHRRGMLRYCVIRLGDPIGEEVMQEVFVTMVRTLRTFRPGPPVEGWLFGMAKHKCQQALRNRTRRQDIANAFGKDIGQQLHAETSRPPGDGLEAREQATRLAKSLTQLHELERIVLHWRYHRGLSVAESAQTLGMSEAAVRKRLQRALRRLKELMDDIRRQLQDVIGFDRFGAVRLAVAALIRRHHMVSGGCQRRQLMPPGIPTLGKAMAQDH